MINIQSIKTSYKENGIMDLIINKSILLSALVIIILVSGIFLTLIYGSGLSIKKFGLNFFINQTWDPVREIFGAFPVFMGTLLTSFLALLITIPFSLSLSIFFGEYYREGAVSNILKSAIELLAGIPSVIYGLWGLFVLVPIIKYIELKLGFPPYGVGICTASLILSIMIIPYSASIGREVIQLTPLELKEAAYSLGATRFEVIKRVIIPHARSGIFAGFILALGRALGETMAVTMVIGNSNFLPTNIFSPANTMASVIANEFAEATEKLYLSSLIELGLLLFIVTMIINITGKMVIGRISR